MGTPAFALDNTEFSSDSTAPYLTNRDPASGSTGHPPGDNLYLEIKDTQSDVDDGTIILHLRPKLSVPVEAVYTDGGGWQNGYTGSIVEDTDGGLKYYKITITPPAALGPGETFTVGAQASDAAGNPMVPPNTSYTATVEEAPYVDGALPTGNDVPHDAPIELNVRDDEAGVDLTETTINIDGDPAYDWDGVGVPDDGIQTGFTGSVTDLGGGDYHFSLVPDTFPSAGTTVWVIVNAQDLNGAAMTQNSRSFVSGDFPEISDQSPAPGAENVDTQTTVGFRIVDAGVGTDQTTIDASINEQDMIIGGAAQDGYAVDYTIVAGGYYVLITPDNLLGLNQNYRLSVDASDLNGNAMGTETWDFDTDPGLQDSPILRTVTLSTPAIRLTWTLPPPEEMLQESFELRRDDTHFPTTPTDGTLIYEGTDRTHDDEDVEFGRRYYYTIFVVQSPGVYVPYHQLASESAMPRVVVTSVTKVKEYVPTRGEFGRTAPLPRGRILTAFGPGRTEVRSLVRGGPIMCPVKGRITSIYATGDVSSIKTMDIETSTGLVLTLTNVLPLPHIPMGAVNAGVLLGRAAASTMSFSIHKKADGVLGRRPVDPRYFYATVEKRDGA